MNLEKLNSSRRNIHVIGFDDAHYRGTQIGSPVNLAGVVCSNTRFDGMLWGQIEKDGLNATDVIANLLNESKFGPQVHLVLLDGITFGGANIVDLESLQQRVKTPVVAVMRRMPKLEEFKYVLTQLPDSQERIRRFEGAGEIHEKGGFVFQVKGEQPEIIADSLARITDQGKVPEALRLAHLIGAAVMTGQSGNRA